MIYIYLLISKKVDIIFVQESGYTNLLTYIKIVNRFILSPLYVAFIKCYEFPFLLIYSMIECHREMCCLLTIIVDKLISNIIYTF